MKTSRIIHSKPYISKCDKRSVLDVIDSGFVGQGAQVEKVNTFFSTLFKKESSFFVNSGTSAFLLALKGLGVKENDEVILPNYLCGSIYAQIVFLKAIPKVIDTAIESFFISAETVLEAITPKTKAILINHPFGHFEPAVFELKNVGIPIIEDVTHSLYAKYIGIVAGSIADVTIASFGSTKFITSGTGGIVSFANKEYATEVDRLLDHDYNKFPASECEIRFNYKMGDVNAALLLGQLKQIESFIKKRKELARKYYSKLNIPAFPEAINDDSVYFRFFIKVNKEQASSIRQKLKDHNIETAQGAVSLIKETFLLEQSFPNAEKIWAELISIPIYPGLKKNEFKRIVNVLHTII